MDVSITISKSVEQNAKDYFEQAKKYKRKIPGILKTIDLYKKKQLSRQHAIVQPPVAAKTKKSWIDKFRWCISSDGFLLIGGRDATTNDIIIKKYLEDHDRVFHTELAGSPFVIIKNPENKQVPPVTIAEAAEFCASYSKSWKSGRATAQVYWIHPDQVSKQAPAGMAGLAKGSFMINGKRNYVDAPLNVALCIHEGKVMAGPVHAITTYCNAQKPKQSFVEIIPGSSKLSDVAKKVQKIIGGDLDEIIKALPPDCQMKMTAKK